MTRATIWGHKLHVSDLDRSIGFYTGVFGFNEVARTGSEEMGFVEVVLEDAEQCANLVLLHRSAEPLTPPFSDWGLVVLNVDDLEGSIAEVKAAGCAITMEPLDLSEVLPEHGPPLRIAMVADPDGHQLELVDGDLGAYLS